jgi:DNA/RNA-binding domain of Phe-tRNA-synthetase-like protein
MILQYRIDKSFRSLGPMTPCVAEISGVRIQGPEDPADDPLATDRAAAVAVALENTEAHYAAHPTLECYRRMVRDRGRSLKKFPPAAERLVMQVRRTGRLPRINDAVDAYNIVALGSLLAIGAHDLDLLSGEIVFRLSPGNESMPAVGGGAVRVSRPGDYVYADASRVLALLDAEDCDDVKVTSSTRSMLLVIQGAPGIDGHASREALEKACDGVVRVCGGSYAIRSIS